jgi:hypothetical protein
MSDEPEQLEDAPDYPVTDEIERFATAMYQSHTAELAQAFGNVLAQAVTMRPDSPFGPVAIRLLEKLVDSIETNPKGTVKAIRGGKD